jgi:DNA-binding NarL/FixJ family response regulator
MLLLDMEMPDLKGVEVAQNFERWAPVRILALSAYDDRQYILELLANGASGYLVKEEAQRSSLKRYAGCQGEQGWVSRRVASQMADWISRRGTGKMGLTSQRWMC